MTKAIIFDCFGVLVDEGWKPFRNKHFGHDKELLAWSNELMLEVSRGKLSHDEFARVMEEKTAVTSDEFLTHLHANPVNEQLLKYVAVLKQNYRIGFLSNVGKNRMHELFTDEQLSLFEVITLSYELGVAKPDPIAYTHTAQQLNVLPEECIFVDDTKSYCKGAEAVGMKAILFTEFDQFKKDIEAIL